MAQPHGHAHDHAHDHPHGLLHAPAGARGRVSHVEQRRLRLVLAVTCVFMVVEAVGGYLADSLALLADAGHMLTDVGALGLSLWAISLARRPPSLAKTYGYARVEILAALANGAVLLVLSVVIAWEASRRLREPVLVDGPLVSYVAVAGLIVNVFAARLLHAHAHSSLNTRGAYLHVLGDLLGSIGALGAGIVVWLTGWTPVDAIVSALIAALIVASSLRLVREATDILMEGTPAHVDVEALLADLRDVPELHDVHDLHVWTLTSGFVALSAHGIVDDPHQQGMVLDEVRRRLRTHGIDHVTFQLEPRELVQMRRAGEGGRTLP